MSQNETAATLAPILTSEQKDAMLKPIDDTIDAIQKKINALRVNGVDKVTAINEEIKSVKKNKELDETTRNKIIQKDNILLEDAKKVVQQNKEKISALIKEAETYLSQHYAIDYRNHIKADVENRKNLLNQEHVAELAKLKDEHLSSLAQLQGEVDACTDEKEKAEKQSILKNENYIYKNRVYDSKLSYQKKMQALKDEKHEAFLYKYHLIDLLRNSRFTISQQIAQKAENYGYNFSAKQFLLKNGLYIAIITVFLVFCIMAPIQQGTALLTWKNILQILSNASPRVFLALGVAGLILLAGTDLSIGRMVGLATTITAIFWHEGNNSIHLFGGGYLNFDAWPDFARIIVPLIICILVCSFFSCLAGFFTARFKMHPFISTMANMLIIFGLWFYATQGTNSGGVKTSLVNLVTPVIKLNEDSVGFPTIILWAIACVAVVWFIWNKTKFGKNMYAVGGNPEAASVSGISVFWVTMGVFAMAGVLYGIGGFLECSRAQGSASAAYGSGWETDAIAACVVGGISFNGGIGKISGAVAGVVIFTALTYALTYLNIDTNIQYVIKGIIILAAVTMDSLKYLKKK